MDAGSKMKHLASVIMLGLLSCPLACLAQDTTTSSTESGPGAVKTEVRNGEVVYVSGNDLVVKNTDTGEVKHFNVPGNFRFDIDGQNLTVHDLKPGMHLTRTITTTTTPKTVQTVRTISGKVFYVAPPKTVILTMPEGGNKQYNVPDGQKFMIDGKEQSVFHLKKGMNVSATVIKETPEVIVNTSNSGVSGTAPPPPAPKPETPQMVGVLLIEAPVSATTAANTEPPPSAPASLPKTGTNMPLIGLIGVLALALSAALRTIRRRAI
jgi:LPXTG-motif cell wall-anchored protein